MNTTEEILKNWNDDSVIDDSNLITESLKTPRLHSKYLNDLVSTKTLLYKATSRLNKLLRVKYVYYNGQMSKEDLLKYKWNQYQGKVPLKSEMERLLETDPDIIVCNDAIAALQTQKETLESILKMISQRSFDIKNAVEMEKFRHGM
jgi:ABC-type Fe3+-hydroxamate transport system substrate-binding protein